MHGAVREETRLVDERLERLDERAVRVLLVELEAELLEPGQALRERGPLVEEREVSRQPGSERNSFS